MGTWPQIVFAFAAYDSLTAIKIQHIKVQISPRVQSAFFERVKYTYSAKCTLNTNLTFSANFNWGVKHTFSSQCTLVQSALLLQIALSVSMV